MSINKDDKTMVNAVTLWLNPRSNNKWWICVLSGLKGETPLRIRVVYTLNESSTGIMNIPITINNIVDGSINVVSDIGSSNFNPETASIKPIDKDPPSPRKILFWLRLNRRNPIIEPIKAIYKIVNSYRPIK